MPFEQNESHENSPPQPYGNMLAQMNSVCALKLLRDRLDKMDGQFFNDRRASLKDCWN